MRQPEGGLRLWPAGREPTMLVTIIPTKTRLELRVQLHIRQPSQAAWLHGNSIELAQSAKVRCLLWSPLTAFLTSCEASISISVINSLHLEASVACPKSQPTGYFETCFSMLI